MWNLDGSQQDGDWEKDKRVRRGQKEMTGGNGEVLAGGELLRDLALCDQCETVVNELKGQDLRGKRIKGPSGRMQESNWIQTKRRDQDQEEEREREQRKKSEEGERQAASEPEKEK